MTRLDCKKQRMAAHIDDLRLAPLDDERKTMRICNRRILCER